ncbi:MAG TPA: RNA methyltransferase [Bacteroidia bacterium]|jgi:TrmH family RNA methyltransferase|nr:RNA methyltransferase [Bacteroidia bacterium]
MISKNQIKNISALHQKKFRKELGLFIAEGPKVVDEFLHSDLKVTEIYGLESWVTKNLLLLKKETCPYFVVTEAELARLSTLQAPNEVLAVLKQPLYSEKEINTKADLFLYLDGVSDPGNMGTIIRMADWFGIKQIFCSDTCADVFNPKVVQSTMGSLARVKMLTKELSETRTLLNITEVYGATLGGENLYTSKLPKKCMLVIGSESHGISANNIKLLSKQISIPQAKGGKTESLNAAVATSIILSEFFRQQNF